MCLLAGQTAAGQLVTVCSKVHTERGDMRANFGRLLQFLKSEIVKILKTVRGNDISLSLSFSFLMEAVLRICLYWVATGWEWSLCQYVGSSLLCFFLSSLLSKLALCVQYVYTCAKMINFRLIFS
jgi:hypothetical protein